VSAVRQRRWLIWAVCIGGLTLMAWSQYAIRRNPNDTATTLLLLGAALVVALVLGCSDEAARDRWPVVEPVTAQPRREGIGSNVLGSAGTLAVVGGALALSLDWQRWFLAGWLALLGGVTLISLGLHRGDAQERAALPWSTSEVLCLLGIFALGTFLRFYRYSDFPDAFSTHAIEEQQTGLAAHRILTAGLRPWEFMLDYYLAAASLALTSAPTFLTIRIPFTVASALSILPVHFLLRRLVATPAALAGTFLFSVSSWNIIYSRCAHPIFLTNLVVLVVLALLVDFGRTRRLAGLPWIGLLSGYTLYSYAGYRGTPVFALMFLGGLTVSDAWRTRAAAAPRGAHRRLARDLLGLTVVVGVVGAVGTPLVTLLRANPNYYFEAAGRSLANKQYYTADTFAFVSQRLERMREAARIFMHVGDKSPTFNDPGRPMLDPITSVCFVGGFFIAACFPRRGYNAFLLAMSVALMLVLTVMVQNLDVRRLQGITVFVATFAALFLDALWTQLRPMPATLRRGVVPVIAGILGLAVLWWNYDGYFHRMAGNPQVREAFKNHYTTLIRYGRERYAREHGRTRYILLISLLRQFFDPNYYYGSHYTWLHQGFMEGKGLGDLSDVLPPRLLPQNPRGLTVVVQDPYERAAVGALLTALYPGTSCREFIDPDTPRTALTVCDLPEKPLARTLTSTLHARYWTGDNAPPTAEPALERNEPFIGYALVPSKCYEGDAAEHCFAEWTGTFEVDTAGDYRFVIDVMGRTKLEAWIDDEPVTRTAVRLAAGAHRLRARAHLPRDMESGARLSWIQNGRPAVVPFYRVGDGP
jgi:hypothetical protein